MQVVAPDHQRWCSTDQIPGARGHKHVDNYTPDQHRQRPTQKSAGVSPVSLYEPDIVS